jgi:hypothetical protein
MYILLAVFENTRRKKQILRFDRGTARGRLCFDRSARPAAEAQRLLELFFQLLVSRLEALAGVALAHRLPLLPHRGRRLPPPLEHRERQRAAQAEPAEDAGRSGLLLARRRLRRLVELVVAQEQHRRARGHRLPACLPD